MISGKNLNAPVPVYVSGSGRGLKMWSRTDYIFPTDEAEDTETHNYQLDAEGEEGPKTVQNYE